MKKKQAIRLNESQLHQIVKESVKKILTMREFREPYMDFMNALERFQDKLYDVEENDAEYFQSAGFARLASILQSTEFACKDVFRHPDGGGDTMVWDNVGF